MSWQVTVTMTIDWADGWIVQLSRPDGRRFRWRWDGDTPPTTIAEVQKVVESSCEDGDARFDGADLHWHKNRDRFEWWAKKNQLDWHDPSVLQEWERRCHLDSRWGSFITDVPLASGEDVQMPQRGQR